MKNYSTLISIYALLSISYIGSSWSRGVYPDQIKRVQCWNKTDQKIITGYSHPTLGIWIENHDLDEKSKFYPYCLDALGRLPILNNVTFKSNNQKILIVDHYSHGYKSWVARIDLNYFESTDLININFAPVLGHHPMLRVNFRDNQGVMLYEYGSQVSWSPNDIVQGKNYSKTLNSFSLDVEGVSMIGDGFGMDTAASGALALSYIFISTVEKVFYSVLSSFETRQYRLNLNVDETQQVLKTFIKHSSSAKLDKPYSIASANCINSLVRVLKEALPRYGFTGYEIAESHFPHNLAEILNRKDLISDENYEKYTLLKTENLTFGPGLENRQEVEAAYSKIGAEKAQSLVKQANGELVW